MGGCDATKAMQASGELERALKSAGYAIHSTAAVDISKSGLVEGGRPAGGTLFHFPEVMDNRMQRLSSLWTVIICVLCAVFWKERVIAWIMSILMADYALRVLGGGNFSALGSLSFVIIGIAEYFGSKPRWVAGPPKQFAAFCGLMFSTLAAFFHLVAEHEQSLKAVGLSFTCALGAAALLEWALNFCLGCFFFSLAVKFGLVPEDVYTTYNNSHVEAAYQYDDFNKRLNEGVPPSLAKHFDEKVHVTVDYKYKVRIQEVRCSDDRDEGGRDGGGLDRGIGAVFRFC